MDDDFWITEISNTPQSDKRYGGGFLLLLLTIIGVVAALAQFFRLQWIEENQLGRRNLTEDQRAVIADSVRERRTAAAIREQRSGAGKGNGKSNGEVILTTPLKPKEKTRTAVAKESQVPENKLKTVMAQFFSHH